MVSGGVQLWLAIGVGLYTRERHQRVDSCRPVFSFHLKDTGQWCQAGWLVRVVAVQGRKWQQGSTRLNATGLQSWYTFDLPLVVAFMGHKVHPGLGGGGASTCEGVTRVGRGSRNCI